jgi:ankyrin repeat protein
MGDAAAVESLLERGAPIEWINGHGKRAFYIACRQGHLAVVEVMLARGVEVNAADNYRQYPLHEAAGMGWSSVVALLLASGADPLAHGRGGASWTPLRWARKYRQRDWEGCVALLAPVTPGDTGLGA